MALYVALLFGDRNWSKGTADMRRRLLKAGIPCRLVER